MHPAPSIILFTTASGLGFGLLAWLGIGLPVVTGWAALWAWGGGLALAAAGLAASAFHLGHPERALLAFTQWRSSWLSREAWAASAALAVSGAAGLLAVTGTRVPPLGWAVAVLCVATVVCTAMIYAQIRAVPRWHHRSTPVLFLLWSASGGALLAGQAGRAVLLLACLAVVQVAVWVHGDRRFAAAGSTLASATGLTGGAVRSFAWPHTGPNYLLREMVHVVGRRHAAVLRGIGLGCACALPVLALLLPEPPGAVMAVLSHGLGAVICRWLFFAEAEHVVGLYYGLRQAPAASETA